MARVFFEFLIFFAGKGSERREVDDFAVVLQNVFHGAEFSDKVLPEAVGLASRMFWPSSTPCLIRVLLGREQFAYA